MRTGLLAISIVFFAEASVAVASPPASDETMRPSSLADLSDAVGFSAELGLSRSSFSSLEVWAWTARATADLPVRPGVVVHVEAPAIRASFTSEGDTTSQESFGNQTFLARYWRPRAVRGFDLGIAAGVTVALSDTTGAKVIADDHEAPRRPYESSTRSAVPVIADARYRRCGTSLQLELGAYLVNKDFSRLGSLHAALGVSQRLRHLEGGVEVHALLASGSAPAPLTGEPEYRSYFGVTVTGGVRVGRGSVRLELWKPFGYGQNDLLAYATTVAVGYAARL